MGTLGELRAALDGSTPITYFDFVKHKTETIPLVGKDGIAGGHGGGDTGIMLDLYPGRADPLFGGHPSGRFGGVYLLRADQGTLRRRRRRDRGRRVNKKEQANLLRYIGIND